MSDDPFKPLGKPKKPKLRVVASADDMAIVLPVPDDAPAAPVHALGAPSAAWTYRDAEGRELGRALRFDGDGGKEFRPQTLWRKKEGALVWRWVSWPEPRPLYGLDRLGARPAAKVILCEGEKAADAAQRLLPAYVAVTSPGGSNAASKADWTPLAGRDVTIWPDADAAGLKFSGDVKAALRTAGAARVCILAPPPDVAPGWDAADAESEGWTSARAEAAVLSASSAAASGSSEGNSEKSPKGARGAEAILELVRANDVEFWRDPEQNVYATVPVNQHRESYPIESRGFSEWIVHSAYKAGQALPSGNAIKDALLFFSAKARLEGAEKTPIRRSGRLHGKVFLDLGDPKWRVVEVDEHGWRILEKHDAPIVRSKSMRPLPEPEGGGDLGDLYRFINSDDDGKKLIIGWLLMALGGTGPFPILMFRGEEGSAKSTITRIVKNLIDPSVAAVKALPKEERVLAVSARHNHVLAFDNASGIDGEMSDALCRIATGAGLSARAMYTNEEEHTIYAKNPLILNGIPNLASRPDLASRALLIGLKPIPEASRMTEHEIEREWSNVAHLVLGVLLDALSCALRKLPETRLERSGRMADFEQFVEAASSALEWEPGEFSETLRRQRSETDAVLVEESELASAIVAFIEAETSRHWEGTPSRLLERLGEHVSESVKRGRGWPANSTALGKQLMRLAPVLRRRGIDVEKFHSGERKWQVDARRHAETKKENEPGSKQ